MARKTKPKDDAGRVSVSTLRDMINKKSGREISFDLLEDSPSEVTEWIPTGSRWLDSIICRGKKTGIPVGRISELAGAEGSGKSYMACQIAAAAQKSGFTVVYFDSENSIDPEFLKKAGCDLKELLYIQAEYVESLMENIEELLSQGERFLFIWDSVAMTPAKADIEGSFDPTESVAVKARVISKGLTKLIQPLANKNSALLCVNQLKVNIGCQNPKYAPITEKWSTPGGKALAYAYSLRLWLTMRNAKDSFVYDDHGYRIGSHVKATIVKSRFGSLGRECMFKITWADHVGIMETESVFDAVSPFLTCNRAVYSIEINGQEMQFKEKDFKKLYEEDSAFQKKIDEVMETNIITKFDTREGAADSYYNLDKSEDDE